MKTIPKNAIVIKLTYIAITEDFQMKKQAGKYSRVIWSVRNFVPMLLIPAVNFYLFEAYISNPFKDMKLPIHFLNIFLFELLMFLFFMLFGNLKWSLRFQSCFFMLIGLANYYVLEFRSAPIMPWDIYSFGTAMSVAGNFKYTPKARTVFVIIGFVLLIIIEGAANLKIKPPILSKKLLYAVRAAAVGICICVLFGYTHMLWQESTIIKFGMYDKLFTPTVISKRDGTAVAFLMELQYISVDKPSNYSKDMAEQILEPFSEMAADNPAAVPDAPNIIVIMNEAFSDPAVLGGFETNEDYMPFVHSILNGEVKNTASGWLNVSVLGGNTANTEFEFLTGSTMAFLPQGSVPYQQYLKSEQASLASHLRSLGYRTIAMHPYNSTGWDRNKVYPLLGFDEMYFIRDYSQPEKIRKYVSDKACYDKIIEMYEEKSDDTPFFVFNVTMQNHSPYTEEFDNFTPDIEVTDSKSKALNSYLSLMKISDTALERLIDYFVAADEDTVIIFFGDHQPTNSVVSSVWKLNGKNGNELSDEDTAKRYKVPFFIWSNFDTDTTAGIETSVNFLAPKILERSGLPLYDYSMYLKRLSENYPVVTAMRVENNNGESMEVKSVMGKLNNYAIVQYNRLFDQN